MTKETARELLPIIEAMAEGKDIQSRARGGAEWQDFFHNPSLYNLDYRIKPEPQIRPWAEKELPPVGLYKNGQFIYAPVEYREGEIIITSTSLNGKSYSHCVMNNSALLRGGWNYSTDSGKTWSPCGASEAA